MAIKTCQQHIHEEIGMGEMRLFGTSENEAIDPPTSLNEAKTPDGKSCNSVMEHTTVGARGQVCTHGLPVAISLRKHEGRYVEHSITAGRIF